MLTGCGLLTVLMSSVVVDMTFLFVISAKLVRVILANY